MSQLSQDQISYLDQRVGVAYESEFFIGDVSNATSDEWRKLLTPITEGCASEVDFEGFLRNHPSASTSEYPLTPAKYMAYLHLVGQRTGVDFFKNSCSRYAPTFRQTSYFSVSKNKDDGKKGPQPVDEDEARLELEQTRRIVEGDLRYSKEQQQAILDMLDREFDNLSELRTITCSDTTIRVNPAHGESLDCKDHEERIKRFRQMTGK